MRPVETKVKVGTAAATVAGAVIWVLQTFVFKSHPIDPTLQSYIYILTPGALTFVGGYLARHTSVTPTATVSTAPTTRVVSPQGQVVATLPEGFVPPSAALQVTPQIPPQLGGTVTHANPAQVPTDLKEPAMDAGQPPPV